ncbi:hypothetical protein MMC14_010736 [Varicellaria rhodocarpa]|nr:hypothetical protein [Varicellaria rhodocarpa]
MKTSRYLNETLFYNPSPATDQFFEEKSVKLFEPHDENSYLDIYVQPKPEDVSEDESRPNEMVWTPHPRKGLESSCSSPREPKLGIDQTHYLLRNLPIYDESPGLERMLTVSDPKVLSRIVQASKRRFRVCFVCQRHSYSRLQVTRDLFETLMYELSILPRFKEFVLLFGAKSGDNEIGPPHMMYRRLMTDSNGVDHESCVGFECAYGLRYVESKYRSDKKSWSVRQTAVYHKYKGRGESSTWVLISASDSAHRRLDRYIKSSTNITTLNPFEIHLILLDSALENWRRYIVDLTEKITQQSDRVITASVDESAVQLLDITERQELKDVQDQVIDILVVLDSTSDTIESMIEKYKQFNQDCDDPQGNYSDIEFDAIQSALQEKRREVFLNRKKVETLHTKVRGTISLLSDLLDLGNGRSLKALAEEARRENIGMRALTEKGTRDAAAVKGLTIITLIYLPATVVSNFFSTEFVSQQQQEGYPDKLVVLSNAWLFAAISIPLTVGTFIIWWIWIRIQTHPIHPSRWQSQLQNGFYSSLKARRKRWKQASGSSEEVGPTKEIPINVRSPKIPAEIAITSMTGVTQDRSFTLQ